MKIRPPTITEIDGESIVRATLESGDSRVDGFSLEYRFPDLSSDEIGLRGDTFLAACLLPSMMLGEDLDVSELTVSPRFLHSADDLIELYLGWVPGARRIRVHANSVESMPRGPGTGLFFSCGVDSFYSLLKDLDIHGPQGSITHLIFVRGYQHFELDDLLWPKIDAALTNVARQVEKPLVYIRTNARKLTDPLVEHYFYNAADTAGAAMLLSPLVGTVQISSSFPFTRIPQHGLHPAIDPMWSTDGVEFVHVGAELGRFGKVRSRVGGSDLAMKNLIVCMEDPRTELNCGRCSKCARTILILAQAGVLERCSTLPHQLDASLLEVINHWVLPSVGDSLDDPARIPLPGDMEAAFRVKMAHAEVSGLVQRLLDLWDEQDPRKAKALRDLIRLRRKLRRRVKRTRRFLRTSGARYKRPTRP